MSSSADDVRALAERLRESFAGRCVARFVMMAGIDRCIVLSSQAFTALIPLLILATTLAPAGQEDLISRTVITKFGLEGESADAVSQLFDIPAGASTSVSVFSTLLLLFSGISFTRRVQKMYRAAWEQETAGVRSALFAGLGLLAMLLEIFVLYQIREVVRGFPLDWLFLVPMSAVTGLVLWTTIPYLLLNREVHWRRLLVAGALSAIGTALYSAATLIYMPGLVDKYTSEFGLFGITIALIGWLLAVCGILVVSAAVGAEFDRSRVWWVLRLKERFGLRDPNQAAPEDADAEGPGLNTDDLLLIARLLLTWAVLAAAVWVATWLVPGIEVSGGVGTYLGVSLVFGLVNAFLAPLVQLAPTTDSLVVLGSLALVVNGVLLGVTAQLGDNLDISGFGNAVLGAAVISSVTTALGLVLRPVAEWTRSVNR